MLSDSSLVTYTNESFDPLMPYSFAQSSLLHEIVKHEDSDTLRYILSNHLINANIRDSDERKPLHISVQNSTAECKQILLSQKDTNVSARDRSGHTPMFYEAQH